MSRLDPAADYLFVGWYDPDKTRLPVAKLYDAMRRHAEKRGVPPTLCLCSGADAAAIGPELNGCAVQARAYVATNTFYVGIPADLEKGTTTHEATDRNDRPAGGRGDAAAAPGPGGSPEQPKLGPVPGLPPGAGRRSRRANGLQPALPGLR